jgi:hypothetical protein
MYKIHKKHKKISKYLFVFSTFFPTFSGQKKIAIAPNNTLCLVANFSYKPRRCELAYRNEAKTEANPTGATSDLCPWGRLLTPQQLTSSRPGTHK